MISYELWNTILKEYGIDDFDAVGIIRAFDELRKDLMECIVEIEQYIPEEQQEQVKDTIDGYDLACRKEQGE